MKTGYLRAVAMAEEQSIATNAMTVSIVLKPMVTKYRFQAVDFYNAPQIYKIFMYFFVLRTAKQAVFAHTIFPH
jgi:hypothetical protein